MSIKNIFVGRGLHIAEVNRDLRSPMYDMPDALEKLRQPGKHPAAEKVGAVKGAF